MGVAEDRTLEFKRDKVGGRDDDKREFLADVSSFANAQGGDLIFGVEEAGGVAASTPGISSADPDAEMQRLEAIIRDGLEPRLTVEMRWLEGEGEQGFLVVRVRPSFSAPHRVKFREHAKFYGRNSGGKYPMDVHELRSAFLATAGLENRLREIQSKSAEAVLDDTLPVDITVEPSMILNYVPLAALFNRYDQPVDPNYALVPTDSTGYDAFPTLEGFITYSVGMAGRAYSAAITHREGYTTSVLAIARDDPPGTSLFAGHIESRLLRMALGAKIALASQGVEGPAAVCLTLARVKNCTLHLGQPFVRRPPMVLKQNVLALPTVVIDEPTDEALLPLCQRLWNSFGYARPNHRRLGAES